MNQDSKNPDNIFISIGLGLIGMCILAFVNTSGNMGLAGVILIGWGMIGAFLFSFGMLWRIISRIKQKEFGSLLDYLIVCYFVLLAISPLLFKFYQSYQVKLWKIEYQKSIEADKREKEVERVLSNKFLSEKIEYQKSIDNLRQYTDDSCGISFKHPVELSIKKVSNAEMSLIESYYRNYYESYFLIGSLPGDEVGSIIFEIVEATSSIKQDLGYKGMARFSLPNMNQEMLYYFDNFSKPYDAAVIGRCAIRMRANIAEIDNKNVSDIIKGIVYTTEVVR